MPDNILIFEVRLKSLKRMAKQVMPVVGKITSREALHNVFMLIKDKSLCFYASDGFSAIKVKTYANWDFGTITSLLPYSFVEKLSKLKGTAADLVVVEVDLNNFNIKFKYKGAVASVQAYNGVYPNIDHLFDFLYGTSITLSTEDLINSLKECKPIVKSYGNTLCAIAVAGDLRYIDYYGIDLEKHSTELIDTMTAVSGKGDTAKVILSIEKLIKYLNNYHYGTIDMYVPAENVTNTVPVLFVPEDGNQSFALAIMSSTPHEYFKWT